MANDLDLRKSIPPQNQAPQRTNPGAAGLSGGQQQTFLTPLSSSFRPPSSLIERPPTSPQAATAPQPEHQPQQSALPEFNMIDAMYADRFGERAAKPKAEGDKQRTFRLPGIQGAMSGIERRSRIPWLLYLRRVPRRIWALFLFTVFALTLAGVVLTLVMAGRNRQTIDRSLSASDQQRQRDLFSIQSAIEAYFEANNGQYPIVFANIEITGAGDPLSNELVPIYISAIPKDPGKPEKSYRYASLTGKSYVLSAELDSGQTYRLTEADVNK